VVDVRGNLPCPKKNLIFLVHYSFEMEDKVFPTLEHPCPCSVQQYVNEGSIAIQSTLDSIPLEGGMQDADAFTGDQEIRAMLESIRKMVYLQVRQWDTYVSRMVCPRGENLICAISIAIAE
jgi:hypothetical protein